MPPDLQYHEITDLYDSALCDLLKLYEDAFPEAERIYAADFVAFLQQKKQDIHLWSVLREGKPVAMALWQVVRECSAAFLWYLAVAEHLRGKEGIGGRTYEALLSHLAFYEPEIKALIYEVELPSPSVPETRARIRFYKRHGAMILRGIHYLQSVGRPRTGPVPMLIFIHPIAGACIKPQEAFEMARYVLDDSIQQVGELEFEDQAMYNRESGRLAAF